MVKLELADDFLMPKDFSVGGWVYVMSNEYFAENVYKIGMTTRTPEERAKELSSTGVPCDFDVIEAYYSFNPQEDEAEIHELLERFRINDNREFFNCKLEFIQDAFSSVGLIKRGASVNELSMSYDFISAFKANDYSDQIIFDNLDIFGDVNHIKNFLISYAIEELKKNFFSRRLSVFVGSGHPKLIKNLDFDDSVADEIIKLINNKIQDKKIKYTEF